MEQSPLTQQARPEVFEPKVIKCYRELFRDPEDEDKSEGFWRELFSSKPDTARLAQILDDIDGEYLSHTQHHPQQLLLHAIAALKAGVAPSDDHALQTSQIFFAKVLSKRYTSPSSDIIEVLAGLDDVDYVFTDLVAALDGIIKDGRTIALRQSAVQVALCVTAGAFQTGSLTYFTQRDLFPSSMKLIYDVQSPAEATSAVLLCGLSANYNKFEVRNPYHVRFSDFVNEEIINKIVRCIGEVSTSLRSQYVAILDDLPQGWSIGSTLGYIGLGASAGSKPAAPVLSEEEMKARFAEQPAPEAAIMLAVYDFASANKVFCVDLVSSKAQNKQSPSSFAEFLSFSSYLYQHAHRSTRSAFYAHLTLTTSQISVEDSTIMKRSYENIATVRLSRQRPPYAPLVRGDRPFAAVISDMMVDSINHNLRRKLDVELYLLNVGIILRVVSYLSKSRSRLSFHWSESWRSLLSFVRFSTMYAEDSKTNYNTETLVSDVVNLITSSSTAGETFLPDAAAYDDSFYKLVETGESSSKFRDAYALDKSSSAASISISIGVSKHYSDLIQDAKGKANNLSPREVHKIIKDGYETLSIEAKEGLDHWSRYREADHKAELKKVVRVAVADARKSSETTTTGTLVS